MISSSKRCAVSMAAGSAAGSRTTLSPTVEPCLFGFTITGNPSVRADRVRRCGRHEPVRSRNAHRAEQALGHVLVHGGRARDVIAARVREACEIQHRLHAPVLTRPAMEREEHHVRLANVESSGVQRHRSAAHLCNGGRGRRLRSNAARKQLALIRSGQAARSGVHREHLVPQSAQRRNDLGRTRDGNVALFARPAEQHRNFHARYGLKSRRRARANEVALSNLRRRKNQREDRAARRVRAHVELTAVAKHHVSRQIQADAGAAGFGGEERHEDLVAAAGRARRSRCRGSP